MAPRSLRLAPHRRVIWVLVILCRVIVIQCRRHLGVVSSGDMNTTDLHNESHRIDPKIYSGLEMGTNDILVHKKADTDNTFFPVRFVGLLGMLVAFLSTAVRRRLSRLKKPAWLLSVADFDNDGNVAGQKLSNPAVALSSKRIFRRQMAHSDTYVKPTKETLKKSFEALKEIHNSNLVSTLRMIDNKTMRIDKIEFRLAESMGLCWGVERAVAIAYEARRRFPGKKLWLTNEIVHNPRINENLRLMDINILQRLSNGTKDLSKIKKDDVVILPAFGATFEELIFLKEVGCKIVDTTCPWVAKVWANVERHEQKKFTSVLHGMPEHEETLSTKSFAGKYLILSGMDDAIFLQNWMIRASDFIAETSNPVNVSSSLIDSVGESSTEIILETREQLLDGFFKRFPCTSHSLGFSPFHDLRYIGVANQTTMMKSETSRISRILEDTIIRIFGPDKSTNHFIAMNTICDATQERQDALAMLLEPEKLPITRESQQKELTELIQLQPIDIVLVIGGFNSSNTKHLLEMASASKNGRAFHVQDGDGIDIEKNVIKHQVLQSCDHGIQVGHGDTSDSSKLGEQKSVLNLRQGAPCTTEPILMTSNFLPEFLPEKGYLVVAITSGASTPDDTVENCLRRTLEIHDRIYPK